MPNFSLIYLVVRSRDISEKPEEAHPPPLRVRVNTRTGGVGGKYATFSCFFFLADMSNTVALLTAVFGVPEY